MLSCNCKDIKSKPRTDSDKEHAVLLLLYQGVVTLIDRAICSKLFIIIILIFLNIFIIIFYIIIIIIIFLN